MSTPYTPYNGTPPGFRVSFSTIMQSDLIGSWTENFWYLSSSLANCVTASGALRTSLFNCKAPNVWMPYVRISDASTGRSVTPLTFPGNTNPNPPSTVSGIQPFVKALMLLANAQGKYTKQWLGGLSARNFDTGSIWSPTGATTAAIGNLFTTLANGGWGIRKVYTANTKTSISSITQAGVVTATAHGLPVGAKVRIGKVVNGLGVNGLWNVTIIDANTFSLNGLNPPGFAAVPQLTKTSYVQLYQWVMSAISAPIANPGNIQQSKIVRATKHGVGRVPNQYSGRRKKKAS